MSTVETSTTSGSPPPESWAGKSRNAKAQARHRAKRKAYIEQLEQTVSKLQTALAMSSEDIANLPTTQVKLRQLRDENDTLRAEIRKLQMQSSSSSGYRNRAPHQTLSPASSEEHLRQPKKRKVSPELVDEYVARNLQAYLGPDDATGDTTHLHDAEQLQSLHISVPPLLSQHERFQMQPHVTAAPQSSPIDGPALSHPRDTLFPWRPFTYPEVETAPISWPFSMHPNHQRKRSFSESSSSSMPDEPYLAQAPAQTHRPMPVSAPYKDGMMNNNGARCDPDAKTKGGYTYPLNVTGIPYDLTQTVPLSAAEDSLSSTTSENNAWSDGAWSYSSVRMQ